MLTWTSLAEQLPAPISAALAAQRQTHWRKLAALVEAREPSTRLLADDQLRKASLALRFRAKSGEPTSDLLVEAFALTREAAHRTIGLRHYEVQLIAGAAMHDRRVVEMQTGEGKTLAATLPLVLFGLVGRGVHLATANDYLARRDAELMRPAYEALGLRVGVVDAESPPAQRRQAYACDVTYGTAKEFGFDFLRDRLAWRQQEEGERDWLGAMLGASETADAFVQRPPHFILVDEADSILIDEARTPLVISLLPDGDGAAGVELYRWTSQFAPQLQEGEHFSVSDEGQRKITLTAAGRRWVRQSPRPEVLHTWDVVEAYQHVERAVQVLREFHRDRQYVVRDGEVVIVDEFTGRLAEGRRWRDGIHQAIEAKESLKVSPPTSQAARVTVQEFFHRYPHIAGMTGTVASGGPELKRIYGLGWASIATNRPPRRRQLPTAVFGCAAAKWAAVVKEIATVHEIGRPVLVGTRSIDKSDTISCMLTDAGIEHQVLNARHVAAEAEIVAAAGRQGKVTIATNMAGRGTDIKLGPNVEDLGGLHVICTEMHDSARIDRQLIGRCGRQGDPGTYRQYLALDDDILREGLGADEAGRLAKQAEAASSGDKRFDHLAAIFAKAQANVERQHYRQRRMLMHQEKERKEMHVRMGLDPYLDAPS
jgi:preprotein translocase subunit SecA